MPHMKKKTANHYIAIVGVMGSGKTTCAKILSKELGFPLIEERPKENPFLEYFYQDMRRWAIHTQLFFMLKKIKQNIRAKNMLAYTSVLHDAPPGQDMVYSKTIQKLNYLTKSEYKLLLDVYALYKPHIVLPDPLIVLNASVDLLVNRVAKRGRNYEHQVSRDYLSLLCKMQKNWVARYPRNKKILLPMDKTDLKNKTDRKVFVETVKSFIQK